MKKILYFIAFILFLSVRAYGQNIEQILSEVGQANNGMGGFLSGLISGFSWWGIIGGFLFGTIGFVAFIYGKKNSHLKPMIIGILLMAYPYFISNTIALYLIGIALTAALYFF